MHRRAVRVVLVDPTDHVLLIEIRDPEDGHRFWIMPGGGIEGTETIHEAAVRELQEELGIDVSMADLLGPVWTRQHTFRWDGRDYEYDEWFLLARLASRPALTPFHFDPEEGRHAVDLQWLTAVEIAARELDTAPRRLATVLPALLAGDVPGDPIDVGT